MSTERGMAHSAWCKTFLHTFLSQAPPASILKVCQLHEFVKHGQFVCKNKRDQADLDGIKLEVYIF